MERQATSAGASVAAPELSATGRVILGLLASEPRTGYEIKAVVDRSTRFFWAASYGQIYPELKQLEADGLVRVQSAETGGRRRARYEITAAGRSALRDWLTSDAGLTYELRDEGLLKFFFSDALEPGEARANLRAMRVHHEAMIERLREIEPVTLQVLEEGRRFPHLTLRGGIELHEFMAGWCRRMEEQVS